MIATSGQRSVPLQAVRQIQGVADIRTEAQETVASCRRKLDLLDRQVPPVFTKEEELAQVEQKVAEITAALKRAANDPAAQHAEAQRQDRMELHGRELGWSLELKPTPAAAQTVYALPDRCAKTMAEDIVREAKKRDYATQLKIGEITDDEYARNLHRLGIEMSEEEEDDAGWTLDLRESSDYHPGGSRPTATTDLAQTLGLLGGSLGDESGSGDDGPQSEDHGVDDEREDDDGEELE